MGELFIAKRNEVWLRANGAIEHGKSHYKFIVMLHTFWFVSMLFEYWYYNGLAETEPKAVNFILLGIFAVLQLMRVWVLTSLGKYWNTKILVIPNAQLVARGPYKFIKHPNYVVVVLELLVLPLAFDLIITAALFSVLNAAVLYVRIKEENKALGYD
ncbi:MAG TPA: isoprenylcysteine carboxylmethyltransferase family protein [Chitinophagales bacterium]|nr:isoprenylcysteine carboxylmethyltransferase family protein [Chitinophagales bacterium]